MRGIQGFHGGGFHGGFHDHGGSHDHHGFHRHHHFHGGFGIFLGPVWGPWPYDYYPPPTYFNQEPPAYIDQAQSFWYYCPNPSGYYPYIQSCPEPWQHVPADSQANDYSEPEQQQ